MTDDKWSDPVQKPKLRSHADIALDLAKRLSGPNGAIGDRDFEASVMLIAAFSSKKPQTIKTRLAEAIGLGIDSDTVCSLAIETDSAACVLAAIDAGVLPRCDGTIKKWESLALLHDKPLSLAALGADNKTTGTPDNRHPAEKSNPGILFWAAEGLREKCMRHLATAPDSTAESLTDGLEGACAWFGGNDPRHNETAMEAMAFLIKSGADTKRPFRIKHVGRESSVGKASKWINSITPLARAMESSWTFERFAAWNSMRLDALPSISRTAHGRDHGNRLLSIANISWEADHSTAVEADSGQTPAPSAAGAVFWCPDAGLPAGKDSPADDYLGRETIDSILSCDPSVWAGKGPLSCLMGAAIAAVDGRPGPFLSIAKAFSNAGITPFSNDEALFVASAAMENNTVADFNHPGRRIAASISDSGFSKPPVADDYNWKPAAKTLALIAKAAPDEAASAITCAMETIELAIDDLRNRSISKAVCQSAVDGATLSVSTKGAASLRRKGPSI